MSDDSKYSIATRFRSFLPVVVDVETGGFNAETDALLEVSAITIGMDDKGYVFPEDSASNHIKPFKGARIEQTAIDFIGIDPYHPLRIDYAEEKALGEIFNIVSKAVKRNKCTRAILTGHNAAFDLRFLNACAERINAKRNPFHPFSCFDTATLGGLAYGQTVLPLACEAAKIKFDKTNAHSARYDAAKTSELFCNIVNYWKEMGGWPVNR